MIKGKIILIKDKIMNVILLYYYTFSELYYYTIASYTFCLTRSYNIYIGKMRNYTIEMLYYYTFSGLYFKGQLTESITQEIKIRYNIII